MSRTQSGVPCRVWYWRPGSQTALLALLPVMLAFLTLAVASAFGAALAGLIVGGVELVLGGVVLAAVSPLLMLRLDLIRIWHGFRFVNIGASEIAGIGLLYVHTTGYSGGWRLFIWRDDGSCEPTGFTYLFGTRQLAPGKGSRWSRMLSYDPVAPAQLPALAATRAAGVSKDLYRRVLEIQGPDGQLAIRHLEKHQPPVQLSAYTQVTAYWSPGGQAGHCRQPGLAVP